MLRILLLILAGLWIVPRLLRLAAPRRPEPRENPRPPKEPTGDQHLRDLTQQEIADADFEELPPED